MYQFSFKVYPLSSKMHDVLKHRPHRST